jgi:hypothetical protein
VHGQGFVVDPAGSTGRALVSHFGLRYFGSSHLGSSYSDSSHFGSSHFGSSHFESKGSQNRKKTLKMYKITKKAFRKSNHCHLKGKTQTTRGGKIHFFGPEVGKSILA